MGIISAIYGGYRYYENKKYEKKARKAELQLQEELTATVEDSSVKSEIEEKPHQNQNIVFKIIFKQI